MYTVNLQFTNIKKMYFIEIVYKFIYKQLYKNAVTLLLHTGTFYQRISSSMYSRDNDINYTILD